MSTFQRRIHKEFMNQLRFMNKQRSDSGIGDYAWLRDMLCLWRPPGELDGERGIEHAPSEAKVVPCQGDRTHLRLAIRNGYINLYREGQSVAKVGLNRAGKIQARIHNKYVRGDEMEAGYTTLTRGGFSDPATGQFVPYEGTTQLHTWIARANDHGFLEKRFVDLIVARNPNVIDVEMGLPACSTSLNERRAPRMDLVALEPIGHGWQIVFWEAKLAGDGRARCSGPVIPKLKPMVLKQLGDYTCWLRRENNSKVVALEYQNACRLLVDLHRIVKEMNPSIEELGAGIREVAADGAGPLVVDDVPRLLIDGRDFQSTETFIPHLKKLRETGLHVKLVRSHDQMILETRP